MYFKHRTLDSKITFAESTTQSLALPRDRWVRAIHLHSKFISTNTTGAVANGMHTIMNKIRVVTSGNDQLVSIEGYRLYVMNTYRNGTPKVFDTLATTDSVTTKNSYVSLYFTLNAKNPFDVMAMIPAYLLSSFDLYIDYGALATYFGASASATTGTVEVTVEECYMSPAEEQQIYGMKKERLLKKYISEQSYTISAAASDYSQEFNIQTGARIQKLGIFTTTSSAYSDSVISKYRIKQFSPIENEIEHAEWLASKELDREIYGVTSLITGFSMYDGDLAFGASGLLGGFDLRGLKTGDVKVQMNTTPASGTIYFVYEQFV